MNKSRVDNSVFVMASVDEWGIYGSLKEFYESKLRRDMNGLFVDFLNCEALPKVENEIDVFLNKEICKML